MSVCNAGKDRTLHMRGARELGGMNVFQNAILTVVWLFIIIMCADLWTDSLINSDTGVSERLGGTGLFISTAVIAHLIIKRILKSTTKEN